MITKFIYTIKKAHQLINEYTTDPEHAQRQSQNGNRVTCRRYKGVT